MALISKLEIQSAQRPTKHEETEATYYVAIINNEKILQITTYGSTTREFPGKASQVIQFDKQSIEQLKKIIEENF